MDILIIYYYIMLYFNIYNSERKNIDFCSSFLEKDNPSLKSQHVCFVTSLRSALDCWNRSFSLRQYRNKKVFLPPALRVIDKPSHVRVTAEQHSSSLCINSGCSVTPCHSPCAVFFPANSVCKKKCGHPEGCNQMLVGFY